MKSSQRGDAEGRQAHERVSADPEPEGEGRRNQPPIGMA